MTLCIRLSIVRLIVISAIFCCGSAAATPDADKLPEENVELMETFGLQLTELTIACGIENKKPKEPKTTYILGEFQRIYAFMIVQNPTETADELSVSFLNVETGREHGKVSVSVNAQKKWKTWAYTKTVTKPGKWEVLVRDKNGVLLGRAPFEVVVPE